LIDFGLPHHRRAAPAAAAVETRSELGTRLNNDGLEQRIV
jgi:hypothetical protein